ncbi:hypothetical protein BRE01_49240 [Brevibacillus reuszeri]|uniref:Uncharacterized protein n=1 Tax=Brevibacillus reuszeri TaxID=54915 RepID=A0ABQ0TTK7_9BACL|nr:hypothetical protein [Brevibacillus reuszeri]MED1856113.1 hypothetical protein [Brevibacillus reuszeri]GED71222.1 hypothetical protein BRE01_49240 [Brevibacillus reuszeri]
MSKSERIVPSPQATKKLVCEILPKILLDLQRKGKYPFPSDKSAEKTG